MTSPDDEIIAALGHSPGDPPATDLYTRVAGGVRRRRRRRAALGTAGLAAFLVAAVAIVPAALHGRGTANHPPSGPSPSRSTQSAAAPPTCAATFSDQSSVGPTAAGDELVPGEPSSAVLCEYDQINQPLPLKRHAVLSAGQLGKMLGILRDLTLTNEAAFCPLQPTVDLLTFGYADGSRATLKIGCAMVWRTESAHAMLNEQVTTELDAILGAAQSSPPSSAHSSNASPVIVRGGGVVLELDDTQHFHLVDLDSGATTPVALAGVPGGPSLIASNPAGGWVVTYTPDAAPQWGQASSQLSLVDATGHATPFGAVHPSSTPITGLAVSPDGSRVAIALMHATVGSGSASVVVAPMPGHPGAEELWPLADGSANQMISLSWAPDGKRLSYIAGFQTGAGIGGDPVTLDTAKPGSAPTKSTWTHHTCLGAGAAWLGTSGKFAIVDDCDPYAMFRIVDATTGAATGAAVRLSGHACLEAAIHPSSDGSRSLVSWCGGVYLVTNGTVTPLGAHLLDAAWGG